MMKKSLSKTILLSSALILFSVIARVLPHPSNVAPIAAIALFSGSIFGNRLLAFIVPILSLVVGDIVLNYFFYGMGINPFYSGFYVVYGCSLLVVIFGILLNKNVKISRILIFSISGSFLFFLITNFSVWLGSNMYPQTLNGFINCYVLALPFFQNSLIGDLFFNCIIFGSYYWISSRKLITA